jgi:hypothetical protein
MRAFISTVLTFALFCHFLTRIDINGSCLLLFETIFCFVNFLTRYRMGGPDQAYKDVFCEYIVH